MTTKPIRLPLWVGTAHVGSVQAQDAALCATLEGVRLGADLGADLGTDLGTNGLWIDPSMANQALAACAQRLRDAGRLKAWRNELLPVSALPTQKTLARLPIELAQLERSAARTLGILTHAVHLIGLRGDGHIWIQQRALNKLTDPGLWDTLSGGLLAAGDTLHSGVLRETHEEAGLTADDLTDLTACGMALQSRYATDGHIFEAVWTYTAVVRSSSVPHNLDGEAMGFDCVSPAQLQSLIAAKQVTQEAVLAFQMAGVLG